jgi:serine/threonine protein kinase
VLALVLKQRVVPAMDWFKATRVLGEGGFGQVLEVVKRDCGKIYAMKVMKKTQLRETFDAANWKKVAVVEQQLAAKLHHPLIVNLAYSFQNAAFLVLVMDTCPGGDLSVFALTDEKLTPEQGELPRGSNARQPVLLLIVGRHSRLLPHRC